MFDHQNNADLQMAQMKSGNLINTSLTEGFKPPL